MLSRRLAADYRVSKRGVFTNKNRRTDTILILYQSKSSHYSLLIHFAFDNANAAFLGFVDIRNVSSGGACILIGEILAPAALRANAEDAHVRTSGEYAPRGDRKIMGR
jgi:hypothetical protein